MAGTILTLAQSAFAGAPLPVQLSGADPRWHVVDVDKRTDSGLTVAAVAVHVGAPDRLVFVTAPAAPGENLDAFARRISAAFTGYACVRPHASGARRAGFAGRLLRCELANPQNTLDCELFVFADAGCRWGILYSKSKDAPETAAAAFALLLKYVPPPTGSVALRPVRIRGNPLTNFPFSLQIRWSETSDRITAITVTSVPENSESARAGIRAGDTIVAIDGRKVEDFPAGVGQHDELGRIFVNRHPGDAVSLEIRTPGATKTFQVTLHAGAYERSDFLSGFFGR